jgi:hypothetical protein
MADAWRVVDGEWIHGPYKVSDRESRTAARPWMVYCNGKPMLQASGCLTVHKRFKTLKNAILWVDQMIGRLGESKG